LHGFARTVSRNFSVQSALDPKARLGLDRAPRPARIAGTTANFGGESWSTRFSDEPANPSGLEGSMDAVFEERADIFEGESNGARLYIPWSFARF